MGNNDINPPVNHSGQNGQVEWNDRYKHFPREYRRSLRDSFDKRFVLIWLSSFMVHFFTVLYFTMTLSDTGIDKSAIDRIQKQFATFILEQTAKEPITPVTTPIEKIKTKDVKSGTGGWGNGGGSGLGKRGSVKLEQSGETKFAALESRRAGHDLAAGERESSREQISNEVSSKGLLGLLTGSGSNAKGEAVTDVLGDAADTGTDLDKILGNVEGLKRADQLSGGTGTRTGPGPGTGSEARAQKGARSTAGGGIDDLIERKEAIEATDFKRKGNIVVEKVAEIADERGMKSQNRDPDKVSEIINNHNSSIQYCYQRELKLNPDLKGKLVVRFTITAEGKVGDVKILSSTLNNANMERCIVSRIRRWEDFGQIDSAKGDATFRQVYAFGY